MTIWYTVFITISIQNYNFAKEVKFKSFKFNFSKATLCRKYNKHFQKIRTFHLRKMCIQSKKNSGFLILFVLLIENKRKRNTIVR